MSREVRITIDDDEVFERMKHRKRELDLSWEDVLHRGLRSKPDGVGHEGPAPQPDPAPNPTGSEFGYSPRSGRPGAGDADWRRAQHAHREHYADKYEDQWDRFADSVEAQVQNKVYNALRDTFGAAGIDVPEPPEPTGFPGLDREMADLSNAEDAVLSFNFLDDDPAYQIPLRVNLQTSTDGLDVDVVAVRQGKNVRAMNHFDSEARLAVTKRLASGEPAVLRFDDGAEGYEVEPVIRWERDESGRPTVTAVDIEAVRLGEGDVE